MTRSAGSPPPTLVLLTGEVWDIGYRLALATGAEDPEPTRLDKLILMAQQQLGLPS